MVSFMMSLSPIFPLVLGFVALLATIAVFALEVVIACGLWSSTSPARILAVVAIVAETIVLVFLVAKLVSYLRGSRSRGSRHWWSVWFASDLIASVLASVLSVAVLILVGKAASAPDVTSPIPLTSILIGSATALGFAFISQLFFIVVYFVLHRLPDSEQAHSLHTNEGGRLSPQLTMRVKSVPYERTKPAISQTRLAGGSSEYLSRPGTSSARSAAGSVTSFSGSLSSVVRPIGSRTRLLSGGSKSGLRLSSLDSNTYRERFSGTEDGFDSWDTSSVDPHNRQMVIETSSPVRPRFLETIPASPTGSRSPSPGCPLDLEPPKRGRRDRSNSPAPRSRQERPFTPSESEAHIHPLFRSDSPGPPPAATPGTVVVAAPNAGQFITGKSVTRMRSGSLPNSPSPLSRRGSYESCRKTPSPNSDHLRPEDVAEEEERKMTPPIPEWILNAGSR